jgi:transporter family-2 protein
VSQPDHHVTRSAAPLAAAVVSGAFIALQQRINGDLGRALHDPLLAAVVSFGTGLLVMALLVIRPAPRAALARLKTLPWWTRLGGLGGATLVAVGAAAAPKIGVALLSVGLVAGSTVGGLLVDRLGLGPGGHQPITGPRLAGAGLCLVAIVVSAAEGARSASPILLILVVIAGVLISFQQAVNGRVREATDATVATFVNFVVGTTALLLVLGLRDLVVGVHVGSWPGLRESYLYLGGPIGAAFVAVGAVVVRQLGVLRLGLALTAGQLLGAILLDLPRGVSAQTLVAAISGRGQR